MNKNKILIIGRVGRAPEMRTTKEGKPVCNFSVAVDNGRGDQKTTEWFEVTCWNRLAELMGEWITKGQLVVVEGSVHLQTYEKRDGTQAAKLAITAFAIDPLRPLDDANAAERKQEQQSPTPRPPFVPKSKQAAPDPEPMDSDELPF